MVYKKDGVWVRMDITSPSFPCNDNSADWRYQITTSGLSRLKPAQRFLSWKIKMVNCSGYLVERIFQLDLKKEHFEDEIAMENLDWKFQASALESGIVDVKLLATEDKTRDVTIGKFIPLPTADSISGFKKIIRGDEIQLSVACAAPMPTGASWVWYRDTCGDEGALIEKGERITVSPDVSTKYYVRAELDGKNAGCTSFQLVVKEKPAIPAEITDGSATLWGKLLETDEGDLELYFIKPAQPCADTAQKWQLMLRFLGDPLLFTNKNLRFLNWSIKYIDCKNIVHQKAFTLDLIRVGYDREGVFIKNSDWELQATELKSKEDASYTFSEFSGETDDRIIGYALPLFAADSISGKIVIKEEESTTLSIKTQLPTSEIDWVWYLNSCGVGKPVHKGSFFQISPTQNTIYFVRAEIGNSFSECKAVQVVVRPRTTAPASIAVQTTGKSCPGEAQKLSIQGGYLSDDAKWAWYVHSISPKNLIQSDRRETITLYPDTSATFFVRGEEPEDTTQAVQVQVVVETTPIGPTEIVFASKDSICAGSDIEFTAVGQQLTPRERCRWIIEEEKDRPKPIGFGSKLSYTLQKSSMISVYAEGVCENSKPITRRVPIYENSIQPLFSDIQSEVQENLSKYIIKNTGGRLAPNQSWQWYLELAPFTLLSNGPMLKIKALEPQIIKLTASGKCISGDPLLLELPKLPASRYVFATVGGILNDISSDHFNNLFLMVGTKHVYVKTTLYELLGGTTGSNNQADFTANNSQLLSSSIGSILYQFNETNYTNVNMYSAGFLVGVPNFRVYFGAGQGEVEQLVGFDAFSPSSGDYLDSYLARNIEQSYRGLALESGVFLTAGPWNFMAGINYIKSATNNLDFLSVQFGTGFTIRF